MSASEHSRAQRARLRRGRRPPVTLITLAAACLVLAAQAPLASAAITFTTPTPNVGIIPFAGDVHQSSANGTLIAVDPAATPASTPLYNLAGNALNVTWGQFSSATAKSYAWTDTVNGVTHTDFAIGMTGLVPNGVYSLFYRTFTPDSNNALCPDAEPTVALTGAFPQFQKPDPDSFIANGSGKALFIGRVAGNLLAATQLQEELIYHFDGKTYGPVTNAAEANGADPNNDGLCRSSYGVDAMRQLLIIQK